MECSDFLRPSRRTSLPSCDPTRRCACRFAPDGPGHVTAGQGFSSGPHCRTLSPGDGQEFPGSWGIQMCLCPALRPRQDRLARPYDGVGAAPALTKTEAPTRMFSGLNHTALALAVYASSRTLLYTTQDSLPAVGHFTGRDWLPAGFRRKVSELLLTSLPPFPSFPGAMSVHFSGEKSGEKSGRVAVGVTPHRSHRSVLAQLRHTARQVVDSLPRRYTE
jgi:hypothetical protein